MNSRDYWDRRAEENALRLFRYSDRQALLMTRWFGRAEREMQRKIDAFYAKYAAKTGVTLSDAKAALTDRRELNLTLEEYQALAGNVPLDAQAKRLLDHAYYSRAVSREEFLILQLNQLATDLYMQYGDLTDQSIARTFEDTYYKSIFDYQQFIGFGSGFSRISTHQIQAAAQAAWKGKNYSKRIWGTHRDMLARSLNRIVTTGFIEGQSNARMSAELKKVMSVSAADARRLIRTECAQVASRANLLAYQENGTPQFKFLATLDYKTSSVCRSMDGKIFDVSEGKIGVNLPPLHPHCRSTTVPYIPDDEFDGDNTRIARNAKGETCRIPASMTYPEWHKQYVEGSSDELLAETKSKHGRADAAQFAKYTALLGRDAPRSLDAFQTIKYTGDKERLRLLELDYRRRNRLQSRPELALPGATSATAADAKFTSYLFGGDKPGGLAKGKAMTSRLGYDNRNWGRLRVEILRKAPLYPATAKAKDEYGQRYEQKLVVNGLNGTPANIVVGWCEKDGKVWMTSAYIKEVD